MKTSVSWQALSRLAVVALLFLFCCSDPDADEITPAAPEEEEELAPEEADALLESFSFSSGKKITGNVPEVTNTALVKNDNGDTIYVLPGVKTLIQISHPKER